MDIRHWTVITDSAGSYLFSCLACTLDKIVLCQNNVKVVQYAIQALI